MADNKGIFNEKTIVDYYGLNRVREIERKNPLAYDFLTNGGAGCVYRDIFDFTPQKGERLIALLGVEVVDKIKKHDEKEDESWYEVLSTSFSD